LPTFNERDVACATQRDAARGRFATSSMEENIRSCGEARTKMTPADQATIISIFRCGPRRFAVRPKANDHERDGARTSGVTD
jgi:hypothetical protein